MRAVVLGGVAWNTMVYVDRFPDPVPHTLFAAGSHTTLGSSGAGKAVNLAGLGADVTLWGLVGDDEEGRHVDRAVRGAGIEFVTQQDPRGTMRHVNLMDAAGDRISIFVNSGSDGIDVDTGSMTEVIAGADLVSVTIMNPCRQFLPVIASAGKDVWVDIHDYDGEDPHHAEFIDAAGYLFMSSVGMADWRGFLESRVAGGTVAAVCTHGPSGASGLTVSDGWIDVPAVPVERLVDTNGAGDAFFAGFATAWLEGLGLERAMHAGSAQAALAIQSPDLAPSR